MKKIIPLLSLLLLVSCNKSINTLPIKEKWYMLDVDKVMQLALETTYKYNDKGLEIESTAVYLDKTKEIVTSEYDDKNNLIKQISTRYEASEKKIDEIVSTFTYTYDDKNRILECISGGDILPTKDVYTYEGDLKDYSTVKFYNKDEESGEWENEPYDSFIRTFNDKGLIINEIEDFGKGAYYYDYTYNEYNCNTMLKVYEDEARTKLLEKNEMKYHKNMPDKLEEDINTVFFGGGQNIYTHKYTYDEFDRCTKEEITIDGSLFSYYEYEYETK